MRHRTQLVQILRTFKTSHHNKRYASPQPLLPPGHRPLPADWVSHKAIVGPEGLGVYGATQPRLADGLECAGVLDVRAGGSLCVCMCVCLCTNVCVSGCECMYMCVCV
jgi:hypothetical protein